MDSSTPMPSIAAPIPSDAGVADIRVGQILDWLARPVAADLDRELRQTHDRLTTFSRLPLSINQFHRILDLFQSRVDFLAAEVKRRLREQPLTRELRHTAQSLDDLEGRIWEAYSRVLTDIALRLVRNRRRDPGVVAARSLKSLRERLELAAYLARPAPPELWSRAHRLHRICTAEARPSEPSTTTVADAGRIYREMLAFAAIQPERLSPFEVGGAADYLGRFAPAVMILDQAPEDASHRLFWVDEAADSAPIALARRHPGPGQQPLYFSCMRLGTLAAEHLRAIEAGTAPDALQLPAEAARPPFCGLLKMLHETWAEPPTRHSPRRRQNYRVSMLCGLDTLVRAFEDGTGQYAGLPEHASAWTVINESPSGYALLHVEGEIGGVMTGQVVAIRSGQDRPWDVCIVRRVLNPRVGKLEIGLQIVAASPGARSVRLAFRHATGPRDTLGGLWLPAVAALRRHDAILIPSGAAASRRFVMAANDGRVRVTQGRILQASLRTARVDLLEFQDDPYPL
jgi:hypothetical protein